MRTIWKNGSRVVLLAAALTAGIGIGYATARQPRMEAALDALRTARAELDDARANKGGHRVRAMQLIDAAIREVRAGIRYAD